MNPDEMVAASARENIWNPQVVPPREEILEVLRAQHRKTGVTREIWESLRLQPPVEVIAAIFGSWSEAIRMAGLHRGAKDRASRHVRGERLPRAPLAEWIAHRLQWLREHDSLIRDNERRDHVPTSRYFAAQLRIDPRQLQRYLHGDSDSKSPELVYRGPVERMLEHAGFSIYDVYPELEEIDDIPLEEDAFCPECKETVTPVQGICPWCETIVRYLGEDAA